MIDKALAMALRAHAGQLDHGGKPYILHPLRVAARFRDNDLLYTVALLHDVVEDTFGKPNEITIAEILSEFGPVVAEAVDCLTRREQGMKHLSIDIMVQPWRYNIVEADHKEIYLEEFISRVATNVIALKVKIADIYDNLDPARLTSLHIDALGRVYRYYKALKMLEEPVIESDEVLA